MINSRTAFDRSRRVAGVVFRQVTGEVLAEQTRLKAGQTLHGKGIMLLVLVLVVIVGLGLVFRGVSRLFPF